MGLNISFFKTPKHRVFNYTPRYYDERKERIQMLTDEAKREKAMREGKLYESDHYVPGRSIRGSMRNYSEKHSKRDMNPKTSRLLTLVTLLVLFALIYYFANYSGFLLKLFE